MIEVYLISELRVFREALIELLRPGDRAQAPSLHVVAAASDLTGLETLERERALPVILLDMAHPEAWSLLQRIAQLHPAARVVALGVPDRAQEVLRLAEAGVAGYVSRDASVGELVGAVAGAAEGELHCSPRVAGALLRRVAALAQRMPPENEPGLTPRETEVAMLLEEGLSNKEIAARLNIEVPTVKNHVHRILDKLAVRTRGQAAAILRRHGASGRRGTAARRLISLPSST